MKIVFLCGSLEPGCDGIGDYIRRMATELIKNGHQIGAIALMDQHLKEKYDGFQQLENISLPVLRLPAILNTNERLKVATKWIDQFNPIWISLQFVPFAFNNKGLPLKLGGQLFELGKGRLWHIMFHELWVGMDQKATSKHILWGRFQRFIIKSLVLKLKPKIIHTQSRLYIIQLRMLGFEAKHLPLFSNIPLTSRLDKKFLFQNKTDDHQKEMYLVIFGAIHPDSQLPELIREVVAYSKKYSTKISLKLIGRIGDEKYKWINAWQAAGMNVEVLGEQSPEFISEVLAKAALGISTCAYPIIDKSGTVAAMLEHGLPVICAANHWEPIGITFSANFSGVVPLTEGAFETCVFNGLSKNLFKNLSEVSNLLVTNLQAV